MPNKKKTVYSCMNHAFVNSSYEQPDFSSDELKDKATFEKYLQGRVCYDRYAMLSRLATDVMAGRIKSQKFNNPEEDDLENVCEHIWKVTEMDRFYLNQRNDEYAKYRSDVGTFKNFVKETDSRYETFKSDPEKYRTTGDLASIYSLGKKERRDFLPKQNSKIAHEKSLLENAIEDKDNISATEKQNLINGYISETLNKIFEQTSEEKETQKWNEAYNKAIKDNNLDEKPVEIIPSKKHYRFFDNNGELEKEKAIEKIASGKLIAFMDETGAMSNIKFDLDNGFVEETVEHQANYKNKYKDMLKTLNEGTSAFTRSSKEYANMRGILDKLSKGIGNEKELLEDLGKNYKTYCDNHEQKVLNGKNSSKADFRKECADKMNETLQQILTNKNADKARSELENTPVHHAHQIEINELKNENLNSSKENLEREQSTKVVDRELQGPNR